MELRVLTEYQKKTIRNHPKECHKARGTLYMQ